MTEAVIRGAKRSAKIDTTSKSGSVKIEGAGSGANASKELTGNSVSAKKNADTKAGNDQEPSSSIVIYDTDGNVTFQLSTHELESNEESYSFSFNDPAGTPGTWYERRSRCGEQTGGRLGDRHFAYLLVCGDTSVA